MSNSFKSKKAGKMPLKSSKKRKQEGSSTRSGKIYSAPTIQGRVMRTNVPVVSGSAYSGDGRVRVRHREYIQDVAGSIGFAVTGVPINPGLAVMFPWLSRIAKQFESYLFRSLKFEYEPQCSSTTAGTIMLAVDYDAADPSPSSKQQLMSYHNAVRAGAWQECCYRGDSADLKKFGVQRYVRQDALAPNLDIKTYDVGNVFVGSQAEVGTAVVGELYVEYDVELITPQAGAGMPGPNCEIVCTSDALATPFANSVVTGSIEVVVSAADTLTFQSSGTYMVVVIAEGTVFNGNAVDITGTATATNLGSSAFADGAATEGSFIHMISAVAGQTAIYDFATPVCATTFTSCKIYISYWVNPNA